jgi:hypothetical protein
MFCEGRCAVLGHPQRRELEARYSSWVFLGLQRLPRRHAHGTRSITPSSLLPCCRRMQRKRSGTSNDLVT